MVGGRFRLLVVVVSWGGIGVGLVARREEVEEVEEVRVWVSPPLDRKTCASGICVIDIGCCASSPI
jgi:hypothetical protein